MKFIRYHDPSNFSAEVLPVLMEHEVQNNLPISFLKKENIDTTDWLLSCVKDEKNNVLLAAVCTPPHNIILYETGNKANDIALNTLVQALKEIQFPVPGVLAEQDLSSRFARAYQESKNFHLHVSLHIMQLGRVADFQKASGNIRPIRKEDFFFLPFWRQAFEADCHLPLQDISTHMGILEKEQFGDSQFLWEDGFPVSMAAQCRKTENGAVIGNVYTPPQFRGNGYAQSLVAALSQLLLDRGNKFCCLFADAANPVSCGIYRKIGYHDLCAYDQLHFD